MEHDYGKFYRPDYKPPTEGPEFMDLQESNLIRLQLRLEMLSNKLTKGISDVKEEKIGGREAQLLVEAAYSELKEICSQASAFK